MLKPRTNSGFTLIEALVAMAIAAVLMGMALPSLIEYQANAKIRSAATNFSAAMQFARTEAIRLNGSAGLILTSDAPVTANANTATPSTTGPNWMVRSASAAAPPVYTLIQGKAAADGMSQVLIDGGALSSVNFNGLGASDQAGIASFNISNPRAGTCVAVGGSMRCLRVQVTVGGQVRICDPAVTTAGDSRTCS